MNKTIGNRKWHVLGGIVAAVAIVIYLGMSVSYSNAWAKKDNIPAMQEKVIESSTVIMEGRYDSDGTGGDNSGQLALWTIKHNSQFEASLYNRPMVNIEANRQEFFKQQKYWLALKQMKNLTAIKPGSWSLSDEGVPKITIVSSSHTKQIIEYNIENNINFCNKLN